MKRILHISKYYYPYRGGIEVVCQDVVEGLKGYQNKVICFNDGKSDEVDVVNGVEVIRCGCFAKIASQPLSWSYYRHLKQLILEWKPDAIHFHLPNPFVAKLLMPLLKSDVKLILHWHLDVYKQRFLYQFVKGLERRLLERADYILVTSDQYRDHSFPLKDFINKTITIHNAMNVDKFKLHDGDESYIEKIKERYGNLPIIFFVGRHVPYKGLKYLLEAEKYIHDKCVILIGGTGPLTEELKASTNSDRIVFLGRLSEDALRRYMYAADIFAFPSISKNESFGIALAEGMYCKAVPVTFTIPDSGVNFVSVNNVTGLEVENRNAEKYAEAIDRLLSDVDFRNGFAEAAHDRVERLFTREREQEAVRGFYADKVFAEDATI